MINIVTFIGHLTKDVEARKLENGTSVAQCSIATNEKYKDSSGELKESVEFHNLVFWRQNAENAEKLLKKGSLVYVEGKITYRKYTDKNGVERSATNIVVSSFRALGKKENSVTVSEAKQGVNERVYANIDSTVLNSNDVKQDDDLPF